MTETPELRNISTFFLFQVDYKLALIRVGRVGVEPLQGTDDGIIQLVDL